MLHEKDHDLILISQIKKGDKKAFDKIYCGYWKILFDYGYNRLNKKEVVEGMVQEVFVNLWKEREQLNIHTSLIGYLKACMKFKILNQIKFLAVKEKYQDFLSYSTSFSCSGVEESLWFEELQNAYIKQVELLPNQARRAYRLRVEMEMSCPEIAKELQLSVSTVEKHLIKANRILRENLRNFYGLILLVLETSL